MLDCDCMAVSLYVDDSVDEVGVGRFLSFADFMILDGPFFVIKSWMEQGENKFCTDEKNDILLPRY